MFSGLAKFPSRGGRCKLNPGRTNVRQNILGVGYEEATGVSVPSPVNGINTQVHLRQPE